MIILEVNLVHFGRFHNKKIKFSQGLNVVYGKNETGKSTIHAFIRCMLLGMDSREPGREERLYEQYFPWDNRGGYGGRMRVRIGDHIYRIERSFLRENPYIQLFDETAGEELAPADEKLKELLEGLNETNFINTISIQQMNHASDSELTGELETFIYNTSQTKNVRISLEKALAKLDREAADLKQRYAQGAEDEAEKCQDRLKEARSQTEQLQTELYQQERRYQELETGIQDEKKRGEEELLAYERDRDTLRRQYEAARRSWDQTPEERTTAGSYHMPVCFLVLFLLFGAGFAYLFWMGGFEDQMILMATAGFAAAAVLFLMSAALSFFVLFRRKKRIRTETEVRRRLKIQLEESFRRFEACKKAQPKGTEELCEQMRQEMEGLEWEIEKKSEQLDRWKAEYEKLSARQQQICLSVADNKGIASELEAVELARTTLIQAAIRVQETFGSRLCKEASGILSRITGGRYNRLQMSKGRGIRIGTSEKMYPLARVSKGTIEQVYLAIRVAASDLLWQKSSMPFLFDDVFAYYDNERLESAMELLKDSGHQVIIFSCNTREDQMIGGM